MGMIRNAAAAALRRVASVFASDPAYAAAGRGRRNENWNSSYLSINAILLGSAAELRAKSHDMARKNPWVVQGLKSWKANAVGTGIVPIPKHPDPKIRTILSEAFERWTDEADADGNTDFYGMEAMVAGEVKEAGEALGRFRDRYPSDGLSVPLQVQLLCAEHMPFERNIRVENGNVVRLGIEITPHGKKVAYHLHREHPGEIPLFANSHQLVRVPAEHMLHVFTPLRPGQLRGVSDIAPVLLRLHEFDQYEDGELGRKRDASMFSGFIKEVPGQGGGGFGGATTGSETTTVNGKKVKTVDIVRLEPNTFQKLHPGEEIQFANPPGMGEGYSDFMRWVLRAIAAGLGITYEQLTGDLTGVNYSSIRAGLLEFRRAMEQWQHAVLVFQFCRPVWNRWLDAAILNGTLDIPVGDYMKNRHLYRLVEWRPQGWGWVDPEKEIRALVLAIRAGLMSREQAIAGFGYTAEQIDKAISEENQRTDDLGNVAYDSDGRRPASGGAPQMGHNGGPSMDDDVEDEPKQPKPNKRGAAA